MLFDNDPDTYAWKTRQLRAPGSIAALLPFPLGLVVRAALAVANAGCAAYLLARATWKFLSLAAAESPSRGRRRHTLSAKRQQFPKMHILAGTFGAVCMREEESQSRDSDTSRTSSPQLQMRKAEQLLLIPGYRKPAARWISTPPEQLTPQSSPNLSSNSLCGMLFDDGDEYGDGLEAPIGVHL